MTIGTKPSLDNTKTTRRVLQKVMPSGSEGRTSAAVAGSTRRWSDCGFQLEDEIRANSQQCHHHGNDTRTPQLLGRTN